MRTPLFIPAFQLLCISASIAQTFPAANGLERSLVAQQPLLKNPVSVSVDVDGTLYVTETTRRKAADLDIRSYYKHGWVPEDVSFTSVEDKLAFFRKQLDGTNKLVKDHNKDGVSDIKDLTVLSEKIIRLTDTNGDGVMDESNVFAEGFNTEVTGIAAGTLAWRGDVYATIAPDMWKLRDTDGDGKVDQRESLAHGFGVHIAYAGHDMHGLTLGPDGRIYWSIGDKGVNVTSKEGENFFAPHEGAVLRCYPDGSGFEIFARGLRNPQEIAFDKYGNLFSVDNDSDQKGERERFLHITEGSDTGWRNYYQYRGSAYNPWMAESIWATEGEFQPAYITPTNANYSDGPAGFAYNPGTALNAKYEDAFFVTEFPKGNLRSFKVKPKGATFEMTDEHTVYSGPMNVGINFGPDGALYSADWSGGYPLNDKGAVWKLDDPKEAGSEIRKEVAAMLRAGPSEVSTTDLVKTLSHKDMRIRLDAQWELAERKAKDDFIATASAEGADQMAVIHSLWGLTQMKSFDLPLFEKLSKSKDAELRAQALKYATESGQILVPGLEQLIKDESLRVRYFAVMFAWKSKTWSLTCLSTNISNSIIEMLAENDNRDAYLRHAGVLALTSFSEPFLQKALNHKSPAVRLAAAVAFRRLSSPLAAELLPDTDPKVVAEAARAIYDDPAILEAYPALADLIRTNPMATVPAMRRSIAANRYLADKESAERLAAYAASDEVPQDLRIAALESLASWTVASKPNPVDGRHDPLDPADVEIAKAASLPLASLKNSQNKDIAKAAADVCRNLGIVANVSDLERVILNRKAETSARIGAIDALRSVNPAAFAKLLPGLLDDKPFEIRIHAASLLADVNPQAVVDYAAMAIMKSEQIEEQQQAILLLAKIDTPAAKGLLTNYSKRFSEKGQTRGYLLLEFSEALAGFSKTIPAHSASFSGGNPKFGEKVFNEHLAAQCTACHRVGKEGSEVGPALTQIGKKGREYILESLVAPQALLAAGYGMMTVTKKDKTSLAGALKDEDADKLTLILPDKSVVTVKISEIASRTVPVSTMPPMGEILSPRELRDLVAYLLELK